MIRVVLQFIREVFGPLFGFIMGRRTAKGDAARDTLKRVERGRDAVADADPDPVKQLRDNEGRW